jgi:hypothetical protein
MGETMVLNTDDEWFKSFGVFCFFVVTCHFLFNCMHACGPRRYGMCVTSGNEFVCEKFKYSWLLMFMYYVNI